MYAIPNGASYIVNLVSENKNTQIISPGISQLYSHYLCSCWCINRKILCSKDSHKAEDMKNPGKKIQARHFCELLAILTNF